MYKFVKSPNELSSFNIIFDGSCLREEKGTFGFSHLIEHLVAGKLKKFENKFNEYGVVYNAATSNTRICYFISGLDEGVCKFKKTLIDIVKNGLKDLTKEALEAEKQIVLNELSLDMLQPISAHLELLGRKKFGFTAPAGIAEDIKNATVESVQNFAWNVVQASPQLVIDISSTPYKFSKEIRSAWMLDEDEYDNSGTFWNGKKKKDVPTDDFCTSFWGNNSSVIASFKVNYADIPYMKLAAHVLGDGLSSPLYDEIRNKRNLAYYVHSFVYPLAENIGVFLVITDVNKDAELATIETIEKILTNPKKYIKFSRFKSICKAIEAKEKIKHIHMVDNPLLVIDNPNSLSALIRKHKDNEELLFKKMLVVMSKVIEDTIKNISTYNGNKEYEKNMSSLADILAKAQASK